MIGEALSFLAKDLSAFIKAKEVNFRDKNPAIVSDFIDTKGDIIIYSDVLGQTETDNLVLSLINVEEETVGKSQQPYLKHPDQTYDILNPDIKINCYVLISAVSNASRKFKDDPSKNEFGSTRYFNALQMLSYAIGFFQYKNVFDKKNSPSIPSSIEKIIMELVSPTFEQQNHLWASLGAKYLPSVIYKLRLIVFREILKTDGGGRIEHIEMNTN
jgi:hypothetical protein